MCAHLCLELPVRIFHWANAVCITVLAATGYLIGNPQAVFNASEAYQQYWFGTARFLHFAAGFVFFFNFLGRIYWAFAGNHYARWNQYLPLHPKQWRGLLEVLQVDIFMLKLRRALELGHNALAATSYFLLFLLSLFQIMTGFALYADMSSSWIPKMFKWVTPLLGGDQAMRQWHHLAMWVTIVFVIVHLYIVLYHEYVEARGTAASIVSGWKFRREDELK
ncbi:MAG: Ni/Fe-hydrogenase, b-type cytochrome subunit [Blastocatellia bacterium]